MLKLHEQDTTTEDVLPDPRTIEYRRLMRDGLSITDIARQRGMGWDTVRNIIDGQRQASTAENAFYIEGEETFCVKPVRCPTCHGMIHIVPCRLCGLLNRKESDARITA